RNVLQDLPRVPQGVLNLQAVPLTPGSAEPPLAEETALPTPDTNKVVPPTNEPAAFAPAEAPLENETAGLADVPAPAEAEIRLERFEEDTESLVFLAGLAVALAQVEEPHRRTPVM